MSFEPVPPLVLLLQALSILGVDVLERPAVARVGVEGEAITRVAAGEDGLDIHEEQKVGAPAIIFAVPQ